jgi:hypothetical protein
MGFQQRFSALAGLNLYLAPASGTWDGTAYSRKRNA